MKSTRRDKLIKKAGVAAPEFSMAVQYAVSGDRLPSRHQLRRWARAALLGDARITVRLVGAREGRQLNRQYRGRDYATNVLTFAYPDMAPLAGDIVLCAPVIARESSQQRKALDAHYAHLVVHGMLHLQGLDHEEDAAARAMESHEKEIVIRLGYADPYREPA
jgi:probable rRNA maturation factor